MRIFKILKVVFCCVLIASCSFSPPDTPAPSSAQPKQLERHEYLALMHLEKNHEVSPEKLKETVVNFLASNAATRSAGSPASAITDVEKFTLDFTMNDFENSFSSDESRKWTDVAHEASKIPFYLFTINNPAEHTSGYILTCADIRFPQILVAVENGSYNDPEHPFTADFQRYFSNYIFGSMEIYNSRSDADIAAAVEKLNTIQGMQQETPRSITQDIFPYHPTPLVKTKWHDGASPYRDVINSVYYYAWNSWWLSNYGVPLPSGLKLRVGCVATAVGQIMAYNQYPSGAKSTIVSKHPSNNMWYVNSTMFVDPYDLYGNVRSFYTISYDWPVITSVQNAASLYYVNNDYEYMLQVGVLLFEIASYAAMEYGVDGGVSYAYLEGAFDAFGEMGYFTPYCGDYRSDFIMMSIEDSKPVYTQGFGHAFLVDNYGTLYTYLNEPGQPNRPYMNYAVHLNLGWGGDGDGWYASDFFYVYNLPAGPVYTPGEEPPPPPYWSPEYTCRIIIAY